jgi:hypothetical protein
MSRFIFRLTLPHLYHFVRRFHGSFSPHKSGNITPLKKQKDFFSLLPKFFCRFRRGCPYPLCTPNSTQGHPMSPKAEGISRGSQPQNTRTRRQPGQITRVHSPSAVAFLIKSVVERSRPRLRTMGLGKHRRPAIPRAATASHRRSSMSKQLQTKYEPTLPSCLIFIQQKFGAKRSTG